jgi:DNA-binding transcriptional LysR family regulator
MVGDLTLMATFVRVVAAGGFSRAARQLGTSQPTVTRQIRTLEDHLGVQLLARTTHGVAVTEMGKRYFEFARGLLDQLVAFEGGFSGREAAPEGKLRVIVPSGFGQDWLVELAAQYLAACPHVQLEWILREAAPRFVEEGIDCAIRVGVPPDETLVAKRLGEVRRLVAAAPQLLTEIGEIVRPEDAVAAPWIALSTYYRHRVDLLDQQGNLRELTISPRFVADHILTTRAAARLGIGLVLISEWAVRGDLASGTLVRLLPGWFGRPVPIYLIYPMSKHYSVKLRRFLEIAEDIGPRIFTV